MIQIIYRKPDELQSIRAVNPLRVDESALAGASAGHRKLLTDATHDDDDDCPPGRVSEPGVTEVKLGL